MVPVTNISKERALVIAAQKGMSATELRRRHVTNTLTSSTVTAAVADMKLSETEEFGRTSLSGSMEAEPRDVTYHVEITSKYFEAPQVLYMPSPLGRGTQSETDLANGSKGRRSPPELDKETGINVFK